MFKVVSFLNSTIAISLIFVASNSFAITPEQVLQQQLILQQQQEQQRQQELNRQQINEAERIRRSREDDDIVEGVYDREGSDIANKETKDCRKFEKIEVIGNKIFPKKYIHNKILKKYIGRCINRDSLSNIQNDITNLYIKKGYITTRVYFNFDKVKDWNAIGG